MPNDQNKTDKPYDLEERTAKFGEDIVNFAKLIPQNIVNRNLISQLVRASTSIGSNYCEADCAETRKDFEHKLAISKKEAKETRFWLRQIANAEPNLKEAAKPLWREATELNLIFVAIIKKSRSNKFKN